MICARILRNTTFIKQQSESFNQILFDQNRLYLVAGCHDNVYFRLFHRQERRQCEGGAVFPVSAQARHLRARRQTDLGPSAESSREGAERPAGGHRHRPPTLRQRSDIVRYIAPLTAWRGQDCCFVVVDGLGRAAVKLTCPTSLGLLLLQLLPVTTDQSMADRVSYSGPR